MKTIILSLALLFAGSINAHADRGLTICINGSFSGKVTTLYLSCIRSNFAKLKKQLQLPLESCYNYGSDTVSPFYPGCIRGNFKKIKTLTQLNLIECYNIGDKITSIFTNCVRYNFELINRY